MPLRLRTILLGIATVVAALATWTIVATIANLALRALLTGYASVEASMDFTLPMLSWRLVVGALASIATGLVVSLMMPRHRAMAVGVAVLLFVFFVPVHYTLWTRFPIWYHAVFLVSLLILPPLAFAARVRTMRRPPALAAP